MTAAKKKSNCILTSSIDAMYNNDCIAIKDIKPGLKNINVIFIVLEIGAATVTKENREVRNFKVADHSACINVSIWDEPGKAISPGDIIKMTKGYASIWRHCLTLYSGKNGEVFKIGEFCMNFNEQLNMSEPKRTEQQQQAQTQGAVAGISTNSSTPQTAASTIITTTATTTTTGQPQQVTTICTGNGNNGNNSTANNVARTALATGATGAKPSQAATISTTTTASLITASTTPVGSTQMASQGSGSDPPTVAPVVTTKSTRGGRGNTTRASAIKIERR